MTCLALQEFDTKIFGVPYHRVLDLDQVRLARDLPGVLGQKPVMVDAKVPAGRHDLVRWLQGLGFRIVCTQIALSHDLSAASPISPAVTIDASLDLDDATISAHAANFKTDRHSLDPLIDRAHRDALYRRWIKNSISGRMLVASRGRNFCTFRQHDNEITIDLLSVLDKRQGIGRALVDAVLDRAARQHSAVRVATECGNEVAWRLYLACGFRVEGFIECLHFVST